MGSGGSAAAALRRLLTGAGPAARRSDAWTADRAFKSPQTAPPTDFVRFFTRGFQIVQFLDPPFCLFLYKVLKLNGVNRVRLMQAIMRLLPLNEELRGSLHARAYLNTIKTLTFRVSCASTPQDLPLEYV